ncbi:MAG: ribonuclease E/G [SAR324 cluster bacterium]|nr:ribonuclease E/G [SAR324 cluster bacterium]
MEDKHLMLINESADETRVALVLNGRLEQLQIEQKGSEQNKGNIYYGVVTQVEKSLQAVFVDYGVAKQGFLPLNEVNFQLFNLKGSNGRDHSISEILKVGQPLIVQVSKDEVSNKGAALTTFVSLVGRRLAFCPQSKKSNGVSQKIKGMQHREKFNDFLRSIANGVDGVIVRTAAKGCETNQLSLELQQLQKSWQDIESTAKSLTGPGILSKEKDLVLRIIRDYNIEDIDEVLVDNMSSFQKVHSFFYQSIPTKVRNVTFYNGSRPLFHKFGVEDSIASLSKSKVELSSGASLVIESTEALVAVDVNSAKSTLSKSNSQMVLNTNLEAADEIARQLRLRNLGGLIVVDFISMDIKDHYQDILSRMKLAMEGDKASYDIAPISRFGVMEITRQRTAKSYALTTEDNCPMCSGMGKVPNLIGTSNRILRDLREVASRYNADNIKLLLPVPVANYLLNNKRISLIDIENEFSISLMIEASNEEVLYDRSKIEIKGKGNAGRQVSRSNFAKNLLQKKALSLPSANGKETNDISSRKPKLKVLSGMNRGGANGDFAKERLNQSTSHKINDRIKPKVAVSEADQTMLLSKTHLFDIGKGSIDIEKELVNADQGKAVRPLHIPKKFCFKKARVLNLIKLSEKDDKKSSTQKLPAEVGLRFNHQFVLDLNGRQFR